MKIGENSDKKCTKQSSEKKLIIDFLLYDQLKY